MRPWLAEVQARCARIATNIRTEANRNTVRGESMPEWLLNLVKRVNSLAPGRYLIILTIGKEPDWTVLHLGKQER